MEDAISSRQVKVKAAVVSRKNMLRLLGDPAPSAEIVLSKAQLQVANPVPASFAIFPFCFSDCCRLSRCTSRDQRLSLATVHLLPTSADGGGGGDGEDDRSRPPIGHCASPAPPRPVIVFRSSYSLCSSAAQSPVADVAERPAQRTTRQGKAGQRRKRAVLCSSVCL